MHVCMHVCVDGCVCVPAHVSNFVCLVVFVSRCPHTCLFGCACPIYIPLSLPLKLPLSLSFSCSLYCSLSHKHTHTHTLSLPLIYSINHSLSHLISFSNNTHFIYFLVYLVTRARSGLVVVGDSSTLRYERHWRAFLKWCEGEGCITKGEGERVCVYVCACVRENRRESKKKREKEGV